MKKLSLAVASIFAVTSLSAVAAPTQMTEAEMDQVVAGYAVYVNRGGNLVVQDEEITTTKNGFQELDAKNRLRITAWACDNTNVCTFSVDGTQTFTLDKTKKGTVTYDNNQVFTFYKVDGNWTRLF
jgi:hypothetical protein